MRNNLRKDKTGITTYHTRWARQITSKTTTHPRNMKDFEGEWLSKDRNDNCQLPNVGLIVVSQGSQALVVRDGEIILNTDWENRDQIIQTISDLLG